jgi:hypothetical protein
MNAWEFHRKMRAERSRAMYAALRRAWRQLRVAWRLSGVALHLRQVG